MKIVLGQIFSLRSLLFGWSYFWRAFLLIQIPYFIILGLFNILKNSKKTDVILINIFMILAFCIWGCFANGFILNKLQYVYKLKNQYKANVFVVGVKMSGILIIFMGIFILPAYAINFCTGLVVGFFFGFHGIPEAEMAGAIKVASYVVDSFASLVLLGFISQRMIAHQLRKENKDFVAPEITLVEWRP